MTEPPVTHLPALAGRQYDSWSALIELGSQLGDHWLLVGGQMVFLHQVERGASDVRPTDDVDVVVDLRVQPTGLAHIHSVLTSSGFDQSIPNADGIAHRYHRAGATFDVLAPDNLGKRARLTLGNGRTIEVPGTSQALVRSGRISVELADSRSAAIRRPTLIGAVLGKAAAATQILSQSPSERAKHLRDVDSLVCLVGAADREGANLTRGERTMLERIAASSDFSPLAQRSITLLASWPDSHE